MWAGWPKFGPEGRWKLAGGENPRWWNSITHPPRRGRWNDRLRSVSCAPTGAPDDLGNRFPGAARACPRLISSNPPGWWAQTSEPFAFQAAFLSNSCYVHHYARWWCGMTGSLICPVISAFVPSAPALGSCRSADSRPGRTPASHYRPTRRACQSDTMNAAAFPHATIRWQEHCRWRS